MTVLPFPWLATVFLALLDMLSQYVDFRKQPREREHVHEYKTFVGILLQAVALCVYAGIMLAFFCLAYGVMFAVAWVIANMFVWLQFWIIEWIIKNDVIIPVPRFMFA